MLRELPPPGVLTTATKPVGKAGKLVPNDGRFAVKPFANVPPPPVGQPAARRHCTTTSGRTTRISIGIPLRAFQMPPISQSPKRALPALPKSYLLPLPI